MRYDAILFDADDTLLDFERSEEEAFAEIAAEFALPANPNRYARYHAINKEYWKMSERGEITVDRLTVARFETLFAEEGLEVDCARFNDRYRAALGNYAFKIEGAEELLQELYLLCPLYLVTNGLKVIQERRLRDSGLAPYFRAVFTSEEIGANKPQPEFFGPVLRAIGVSDPRRLLICGDSMTSDIRGGNLAGMDTCWFDPHGGTASEPYTYRIERLCELLPLVKN